MALELNKKSDNFKNKRKLSFFGKLVTSSAVVIIIILIFFLININNKRSVRLELKETLSNVIATSLIITEQSLTVASVSEDVMNEFFNYKNAIEKEKNILSKYSISIDMLTFALEHSKGNTGSIDELNSIRNRLEYAFREYKKK